MGKFTPLFTRDGDTFVVPATQLEFDTAEAAVEGGANAGLVNGYGLAATGDTAELTAPEGDYPGPFLITAVGNLNAWIVGGPTLDRLLAERNDAVTNLPEAAKDFGTAESPATATEIAAEPSVEVTVQTSTATLAAGDHIGPTI